MNSDFIIIIFFLLSRVNLDNVSGGIFIKNPILTSSITAIRVSALSVMEFVLSLGMKTTYKADLEVVFTPELRSSGGPQELI